MLFRSGKYNLKVTVKDRVTSGVDEVQVPLVIVADPSVTLGQDASTR